MTIAAPATADTFDALRDAPVMMSGVLVLAAISTLHVAFFTGLTWALLVAVGGAATEVAFGSPPLIRFRRGEVQVSIGPFPNASVAIAGRASDEPVGPRDWRRLALSRRLLVLLAPWLVVAAIAIACLGPAHAARSFAHGLGQALFVLDLTPLIRRFLAIVAAAPLPLTIGLTFAKLLAINSLPFAGLAGGGVLQELFGAKRPAWIALSMVAMLWVTLRMLYAVVRVFFGG